MRRPKPDLWPCPDCGRHFANRNQSHACARHALAPHFEGKAANVRAIYDAFAAMLAEFGPVTILPEKTRIAFQVRMSFAQLTIRRKWVLGHFVLARPVADALFTKVETISPRNHVHHFRLDEVGEVGALRDYAGEAYAVGRQDHLG
jgi:hypothetical protein